MILYSYHHLFTSHVTGRSIEQIFGHVAYSQGPVQTRGQIPFETYWILWQLLINPSRYFVFVLYRDVYDEVWQRTEGALVHDVGISIFTVISGFPSPLHALDYRFPIMEHIGFQYTLVRRWEFEVALSTPSGVWRLGCVELRYRHGKRMPRWTENKIASAHCC